MPSLALPERLIWFAHCPKTGGTSIEQIMVAQWGAAVGHLHWGWDLWWQSGGWRLADPPNSPQHLVWEDAAALLPETPDVVFAVVRDPAARMASEHRWQRRGRRGTRIGKALACLPFSLWLRLMLAVVQRNPYAFDNHLRPQSAFVPDDARVFRLEDGLQPVAKWLEAETGTSLQQLPHAISTGVSKPIRDQEKALIGTAFATDYVRFGYAVPDRRDVSLGWIAVFAPLVAWLDKRGRL